MPNIYDSEHKRLVQQYCRALRASINSMNVEAPNSTVHDHRVFIAREALISKERFLLDDMAIQFRLATNKCKLLSALCKKHGINVPHCISEQRGERH